MSDLSRGSFIYGATESISILALFMAVNPLSILYPTSSGSAAGCGDLTAALMSLYFLHIFSAGKTGTKRMGKSETVSQGPRDGAISLKNLSKPMGLFEV